MGIQIAPPVFSGVIEASDESKEPHLLESLENMAREDPSFHYNTDRDSGQLLISGMGELHMEIIKDRLLNHYSVGALFGKMQVSYRVTLQESIAKTFEYSYELTGTKQSAVISLLAEPLIIDEDEEDIKENIISFKIPKSTSDLIPQEIDAVKAAIGEGVSYDFLYSTYF